LTRRGPVHHTAATRAKMSATRRRRGSAAVPHRCSECGGRAYGTEAVRFRGAWVCELCLNDEDEPDRATDFMAQPSALSWDRESWGWMD